MAHQLPPLILTGASGIVGRGFLEAAREDFLVYAVARRSQREAAVAEHPNVLWVRVDLADAAAVERLAARIERRGGADFLVHLAAYYDFDNEERPEYRTTNVEGTRHVLELARRLRVKRFVFASSVAACGLPVPGEAITEETPADADSPYARSKRIGERLVRDSSRFIPCSIVRLAAVFSDWCEHAPLYVFLSTWLAGGWNARMLAGRGLSAVPYIHARDVNRLLLRLLERAAELPACGLYLASPDGATTQRELFELATRCRFGRSVEPLLIPTLLARPGVLGRDLLGRLRGRRPFERAWMLDYADRQMTVDASRTRRALGWVPTPPYRVLRRLPVLIDRMSSWPREWKRRNERAMKRPPVRPAPEIDDRMMGPEGHSVAVGAGRDRRKSHDEERRPSAVVGGR